MEKYNKERPKPQALSDKINKRNIKKRIYAVIPLPTQLNKDQMAEIHIK